MDDIFSDVERAMAALCEPLGDCAPAVFFRRSRSPWCVVMKLEDWIKIYQKGEQQHEKQ